MIPVATALLFAAAFAVYALLPFLNPALRNKRIVADSFKINLENLKHKKEEVLSVLNDLEYDFHMHKMSEEDYLHQE